MAQDTVFSEKIKQIFDQRSSPLIMGILNVTPDSFSDGGKYLEEPLWLEQTTKMLNEGAAIIDIGAYSTRPGAEHISEQEEEQRLLKVVSSVRKHFPEVLISVDTFRAAIAEKAVQAGANIINDISGGTMDAAMFTMVARLNVPYVLMHIQGTPQTMQKNPVYLDVVKDVGHFFQERIKELNQLGFSQIILDPGFGFGKTLEHNFDLMKNLEVFQVFGLPVLVGVSKKSMINKLLNISNKDGVNGTSILNTIAIQKGAKIIRVHDVKPAQEVLTLLNALS